MIPNHFDQPLFSTSKVLEIYIFIVLFILIVLGFVNWNGYFGFKGFDIFLETLRKGQISKVSVFDAFLGKGLVSFGNWQPFNAAILFTFVTVLIGLIYNEGIPQDLGFIDRNEDPFQYEIDFPVMKKSMGTIIERVIDKGVVVTIVEEVMNGNTKWLRTKSNYYVHSKYMDFVRYI